MISRKIMLYGMFFLTIAACNKIKEPEKPKNLLSKEEMVNIIIDAKLISSASSVNKRTMRDSGVVIEDYVFKRHDIDSLQFTQSNNFYAFHLKDYEDIYNQVSDSLEKLKDMLKEQQAEEWKMQTKREEDSLNAIKKDSLKVSKAFDSLDVQKKRDSLTEALLQQKFEQNEILLEPILDTDSQ